MGELWKPEENAGCWQHRRGWKELELCKEKGPDSIPASTIIARDPGSYGPARFTVPVCKMEIKIPTTRVWRGGVHVFKLLS